MLFSRSLIAIDIGSSAIKVVELAGGRAKKLRAIGLEVLPPGAVVDGMIQNQEAVEEVLRTLLKKLKISPRGRRAALALGGSSVLIKKVEITGKGGSDLGEQVYYEAEQAFQMDMADIYFDHVELGQPAKDAAERQVLIVGAKREMVEQYLTLVRAVGMRTGVVECDVFSVANMFEYNYGVAGALTAIVNVGASATQVSLISGGEYLYTRDVPIAGEEYTRQVMQLMSVDRDQAESLKISAGQPGANTPPELVKLINDVNEQLVNEVHVTIDYFFQSGDAGARDASLAAVFLTGGGARIAGLDAALAAAMAVPVTIVNPFQRVDVNPRRFQMEYLALQGHLYGVAVGLGMREMGDKK